ncbi:MAG: ATP synthase F0 subunit B [Acidobacteria bacterium]|nr:ATP synthase F0 subunit B [Acidobacteriota bacterium]
MRRVLAALLAVALVALPALAAEGGGEEHGGDTLTTIFKWINFLSVFGALGWLLRKPMREFFTGQRAAIQVAINEGRLARQQADQRVAEIEKKLANLGQEVEALRKEATEHAAAEQQRIREAARREAERILATAQAEIESTARAARLELRAYAARLAVNLAEQRIRQRLTSEVHAALIDSFVLGLGSTQAGGRA